MYVAFCHDVDESQRTEWEAYTGLDKASFLADSYEYFDSVGVPYVKQTGVNSPNTTLKNNTLTIFQYTEEGAVVEDPGPGPYLVRYRLGKLLIF
jgi:hypothetical protein